MEKSETIKIGYYLRLVSKHRWLIIIPFCIAMVVGMYFAVTRPKIYEAKTLILVMPQRVPSDYVQSIVSSDLDARIRTISQQILSRTNLEKVIEKYGLFSGSKYSGMFSEDMVAALRKRIIVEVNQSRRRTDGTDAFSITFSGLHPETVMKVTNGLAGSFIQENLRIREVQAVGTSEFLANELETGRKRLEEVEEKIREYRGQYMGELPDQLDANLRMLERLQMQLSERETALRDEKSRLVVIENQIEANRRILTESGGLVSVSENEEGSSLAQLKAQLAGLQSNYTDRHPDVIKLKSQIADLESKYQSGELESSGATQSDSSGDPAVRLVSNTITELERQRLEIRGEIINIGIELSKIKAQLEKYQERVERTPQREQELMTLNRDYENMQESYTSLLNRKLEAEISVNMEKKQKGEQFRIIDQAALPQKPVSPDMRKLFLLSVAAGLGFGAGLIFLLDFLNTSLKQPKVLETEFGLSVLASIPKIYHRKDKIKHWVNQGLTAFSLCIATVLTAGFALLVLKGVDPTLQFIRQYAGI